MTDTRRDPQVSFQDFLFRIFINCFYSNSQSRLVRYLKSLYIELALKEPIIPSWTQPIAPGALCAARLEPELRLHNLSHGLSECIAVDQLLMAIHVRLSN